MSIDYNFAVEMFTRYAKHLEDVVESINTMIATYQRREKELLNLVEMYPEKYQRVLDEVRVKQVEAEKKLSLIVPRMKKMADQVEELKKEFVS